MIRSRPVDRHHLLTPDRRPIDPTQSEHDKKHQRVACNDPVLIGGHSSAPIHSMGDINPFKPSLTTAPVVDCLVDGGKELIGAFFNRGATVV
jgi:hypothetical protein